MRYCLILVAAAMFCLAGGGCQSPNTTPEPAEKTAPTVGDLGMTIGDLCEFAGYQTIAVQGYGLVWNLADTGSAECPPSQLEAMLTHLRQIRPQRYLPAPYDTMSAEQLLNSRKTAVVQVSGLIGPGVPKGSIFNVNIKVAPATQTTSLVGGNLLETDLRMVMANPMGRPLDSRVVATAEGSVFINPFPQTDTTNIPDETAMGTPRTRTADPRSGMVLGGGRTLHDRLVQLDLIEPDFRMAAQIQRRINGRFAEKEGKKVADASRSRILINLPDRYRDNPNAFYGMLAVMYLQDRGGYLDLKLRELAALARQDDANLSQIALAWQAIGRTGIPSLQDLYDNMANRPALRFYAARTALQLGDRKAIDTLGRMAMDNDSAFQRAAATALGLAPDDIQARALLGKLLNHGNDNLRLIAYEQLRNDLDPRIQVAAMPGGFQVERAPSDGRNLLCVWATTVGRIVFIGKPLQIQGPLFYESPDTGVIVDFRTGASQVNLTRTDPITGDLLLVQSAPGLKDIIAAMAMPPANMAQGNHHGLGLSFSQIVGILYELCGPEVQGIDATFVLHRRDGDLMP